MIGGSLNIKHLRAHWDEILRLAASIKQGTVTAPLMLRKLESYPRQNSLAIAMFFNRLDEIRSFFNFTVTPYSSDSLRRIFANGAASNG